MAEPFSLGQGGIQILIAIFMYLIYQKSHSPFIKNVSLIVGIVLFLMGITNLLQGI